MLRQPQARRVACRKNHLARMCRSLTAHVEARRRRRRSDIMRGLLTKGRTHEHEENNDKRKHNAEDHAAPLTAEQAGGWSRLRLSWPLAMRNHRRRPDRGPLQDRSRSDRTRAEKLDLLHGILEFHGGHIRWDRRFTGGSPHVASACSSPGSGIPTRFSGRALFPWSL